MMVDTVFDLREKFAQKFCEQMTKDMVQKPRHFRFANEWNVPEVFDLREKFAKKFCEQMTKDMVQKPRRFCFANDIIKDKKNEKPAPMEMPNVQEMPNAKKIFKKQ